MFEIRRFRLPLRVVLWALIALVLCIGCAGSYYVYRSLSAAAMDTVVNEARSIGTAISPSAFYGLSGTASDIETPQYRLLKEKFMALRAVHHEARFVYAMGIREGVPYFIVDSESPDSEDYSPPGETYSEASDALVSALTGGPSGYEIAADSWGVWLSGFAPVIDPESGRAVAVIGLDIDWREQFLPSLIAYSVLPITISGIVALGLLMAYMLRLREEERLYARVESLSIASHEIRTPLTGIAWAAESLMHESSLSSGARGRIVEIYASTQEALERVENLLMLNVLAHKRQVPFTPLSVSELLGHATSGFTLAANARSMRLSTSPVAANTRVMGDVSRLKLLFSNLISNAIKYGAPETEITISTTEEGTMHAITVSNHGAEIPQSETETIFDGYHRTEEAQAVAAGTGLGLHLVRQIATLHGGAVTVQSQNGITAFTVQLPKA